MEYIIYFDIIWNYEVLKNNNQVEFISVVVMVEMNGEDLGQCVCIFFVWSVNECLLGYVINGIKFYDMGIFFVVYVNEENLMIDQLFCEVLNIWIVNCFLGYQNLVFGVVDKQVYVLWNVLQKCKFCYSLVFNISLFSNVVYFQCVCMFDDVLELLQINCVDGSVLFVFLFCVINIELILVCIFGYMFVGYYIDNLYKDMNFLEIMMIGDVDLDDFFFDE